MAGVVTKGLGGRAAPAATRFRDATGEAPWVRYTLIAIRV